MPKEIARIRRHPERALALPDDAARILEEALVAHVGIVQDGRPVVIPMTFQYLDGQIYLHGAPGSRLIRAAASGVPLCVEATVVEGLIASKSAATHSINYRSVVCFGRGRVVRDRERRRVVLEAMIARYFPGRTAGEDYAPITEPDDKRTRLVEVAIEAISAKGRSGGPRGPLDGDPAAPGNAGVAPLTVR